MTKLRDAPRAASLDTVLCTEELERRTPRPADYEAENRAITTVVDAMAYSPSTVMKVIADAVLAMLDVDAAGVSMGADAAVGTRLHWRAVSGVWESQSGRSFSRDACPSGEVLTANRPLLFSRPERRYTDFRDLLPPAEELLLAPFHAGEKAVGAIWAVSTNPQRTFDAEDRRQLVSVANVGSSAYQAQQTLDASARLASIVESSDDAIVSKDLNGVIQSWNAGAERLFGYTAAEAIGRPITMIIPEDRLHEEPAVLDRIRRGERIEHYETVRKRKDGSLFEISLTVSPVTDARGRVVGASKIARDITDRKAAERAMHDADRRKNEFLSLLAHELRNPLAPIRNTVEILQRFSMDDARLQPAADMMRRQVAQMERLIDDLLDVGRITGGKVELQRETVEVTTIVRQAVDMIRPTVDAMEHELAVSIPPVEMFVDGDPVRLTQIIGNVLHNACKFTNRRGRVGIGVQRERNQVAIRIWDTGIGIAPQHISRIFEKFEQVDTSLERSRDGLGLGLTLVKWLLEMHGGTIEARSPGLGLGSEFVIRLPLVDAPAARSESSSGGARSVRTRRILVVDDNRDSALSLGMLLRIAGHDVHTAHDGLDAVTVAATIRPDIVILDLGLPRLNGYDAAKRIRENAGGHPPRMVALTGWGQDEDRRRTTEAGFDAHLVKPVDLDALTRVIEAG
ncbi:MAG TPA: PAS domain S-box protein [Gemmatimonadaceae bacterium]|nr:PAS domain S-box protein [Gemmatimonadaceae bacterium]